MGLWEERNKVYNLLVSVQKSATMTKAHLFPRRGLRLTNVRVNLAHNREGILCFCQVPLRETISIMNSAIKRKKSTLPRNEFTLRDRSRWEADFNPRPGSSISINERRDSYGTKRTGLDPFRSSKWYSYFNPISFASVALSRHELPKCKHWCLPKIWMRRR